MIRTIKWVYKLGYENSQKDLTTILERARDYHYHQAMVKRDRSNSELGYGNITSKQHEQRSKAIEDVLNEIDPKYKELSQQLLEAA